MSFRLGQIILCLILFQPIRFNIMFSGKFSYISRVVALLILISFLPVLSARHASTFSGKRAYEYVQNQVAYGPRIPGSSAHSSAEQFISSKIIEAGWMIKYQDLTVDGKSIRNIIGYRDNKNDDVTILMGTHYDTRIYADRSDTSSDISTGVPGANDGASGVAVLLELIRTLPRNIVPVQMVFFDAEDNYGIEGWEGSIGSRAYVEGLIKYPQSVVILDMVGDRQLTIYYETNSDKRLSQEIWLIANELNFHQFIQENKYSMLDDHTPFIDAGIPTALIIDYDYEYWHTTFDTTDKVSPESLDAVGDTIWTWIVNYSPN